MIKITERSRNLASQVLLQRRSNVDDDRQRYLMASHTQSPAFNRVSKAHADRLAAELLVIDQAIEELRTC